MSEALYVDSSAVVKAYALLEPGRPEALQAFARADTLATSRITYVEVSRAVVGKAQTDAEADRAQDLWAADWRGHHVVDVSQPIVEHAASLAAYHGLRSLDAIHLASALALPSAPLRFATWDRRLWDGARAVGLRVVPAERP